MQAIKEFKNILTDIHMDSTSIDSLSILFKNEDIHSIVFILAKERENILNNIHKNQSDLELLDYLIFTLKNNKRK